MKASKPSPEEHRQQMISILHKSDLNELTMSVSKFKEYRKLMLDRDYANADDLYISIVAGALIKSDRKAFQDDVVKYGYKIMADNRGKQKTEEANKIKQWLYPLLAECEAEFPPERKNRGWTTMKNKAINKITRDNLDDPRKKYLTRARIQTWIDEGRPKFLPV